MTSYQPADYGIAKRKSYLRLLPTLLIGFLPFGSCGSATSITSSSMQSSISCHSGTLVSEVDPTFDGPAIGIDGGVEDRDRDPDGTSFDFTGVVLLEHRPKRETRFLVGVLIEEEVGRLVSDIDDCIDRSVIAKFIDLTTAYARTKFKILK